VNDSQQIQLTLLLCRLSTLICSFPRNSVALCTLTFGTVNAVRLRSGSGSCGSLLLLRSLLSRPLALPFLLSANFSCPLSLLLKPHLVFEQLLLVLERTPLLLKDALVLGFAL
jgi:hypothetical protein